MFISGSFFDLEERRFVIFGGFVNVVGFFIWLNEFVIKCLIFGLMCFVICLLLIVLVFLIVEYEFRKYILMEIIIMLNNIMCEYLVRFISFEVMKFFLRLVM